jgi:tripartite-type tricarboxylate transporter receptor subunit TctC
MLIMRKYLALLIPVLTIWVGCALAQTYPTQPITLIIPFAAGGPNDVLARIVTAHMRLTLGQQIVIENVAGAGGTIGSARAAIATPDGYTILSGNLGTHAASYAYYPDIRFHSDDFTPIGIVASTPNFIAVRKDFPATTLAEFIAYAKNNPNKITVGHAGNGSNGNLVCLQLMSTANIQLQLVPYRGSGPAMNDLVAQQIDAMCDSSPTIVPQAQAGTIRALVVAQGQRSDSLPNVPTSAQAGLPSFEVVGWNAFFAPKGTPTEIVANLNHALGAALADPSVQQRISAIGANVPASEERTAEWLDGFVKTEVEKWGAVVRASGVTAR